VVLATLDRGDCILCQVTSQPYDGAAVKLTDQDFAKGSLQRLSYARPGKLFTAHETLFQHEAGRLAPESLDQVREHVVLMIRGENVPGHS